MSECCSFVASMEACTRSRSWRRLTRAARGQAYLALSQPLARPSRFQLLERPFEKNGTQVAKRALLPIGELQKFVSEMRPDSHRHACLPYAHGHPLLTVRRRPKQTKQCFICFVSFALWPLCSGDFVAGSVRGSWMEAAEPRTPWWLAMMRDEDLEKALRQLERRFQAGSEERTAECS